MQTKTMKSEEARLAWRNILDSAAGGDDVVIERYRKPTAVLIGYEDYIAILDELEEMRADRRAIQAYEEWKADPSDTISLEEFRDELIAEGLLDADV